MADHKVAKQYWPERVEVVAELPTTPAGKIQKFQLKERAKAFGDVPQKASGVSQRFAGRVCVVTGAARGIGFSIAERLGREGGLVAALDVSARRLEPSVEVLRAKGFEVRGYAVDVGGPRGRAFRFRADRGRLRRAGCGARQQCGLGAISAARGHRRRDFAPDAFGRRRGTDLDDPGRGAANGARRRRRDRQSHLRLRVPSGKTLHCLLCREGRRHGPHARLRDGTRAPWASASTPSRRA